MKHRTLEEITKVAHVVSPSRDVARAIRRQRLERLADILDAHTGEIRLLSRIECLAKSQALALRQDDSPLSLAYQDAEFRRQGLMGDQLGDATAFFDISLREAHDVFCDCHYVGLITPGKVAQRARHLARKMTLSEMWDKVRGAIARRWTQAPA